MSDNNMVLSCLNKLKEKTAKVVTSDQKYFDRVCNSIDDYVVDEMISSLTETSLEYGYFEALEMPPEIREWLLLHYSRDGYNIANRDQNKIHKFYENGEEMFAIAGAYGVFIYDKHFNYIKSYRESTGLRAVYVDIDNDIMLISQDFRIFGVKYSTMEELWVFGNGSRGELGDNRLNYVKHIQKLPNGNYGICQLYGKGYDKDSDTYLTTKSEGVIFEIDAQGNYIKSILYRGDDSYYPEQGYIKSPRSIRIIGNKVYVATYINQVAVFELDSNNVPTYITNYTPPPEFGITFDLIINDFCINDTTLVVISEALKQVIGFDLQERRITFISGIASVENLATSKPKINGIYAPKGVIYNDDGDLVVTDDFNDMVKKIYPSIYKDVEYNIPADVEVVYSSLPHKEANKFTTKIDNYEKLFLLYKQP